MNKLRFKASLQQMASKEILETIPASLWEEIKEKDAHPLFKTFCIAHEGVADSKMVGSGRLSLQYFKDAVRKVYDRIKSGLPVFSGHAATNDHAGRELIGEVVGGKVIEQDGILKALATVYIKPEKRNVEYDIASIEADALIEFDNSGSPYVKDIEKLTGIAIAKQGERLRAGFAGATLLGALQAFRENPEEEKNKMEITLKDVREFVKAGGLRPSDLFGKESLLSDGTVVEIVNAAKHDAQGFGMRKEAELQELKDKIKKEQEETQKKVVELTGKLNKYESRPILEQRLKERKIDDAKLKDYIDRLFLSFTPATIEREKIAIEIDQFLNNAIKDYEEKYEFFVGKKQKTKQNKDDDKNEEQSNEENSDLTIPKNNPLIP